MFFGSEMMIVEKLNIFFEVILLRISKKILNLNAFFIRRISMYTFHPDTYRIELF
jgi:hypothetical protein